MNPVLIYFLKVNVAIILFYGFYKLLFSKDTFFHLRRAILLSFLIISVIYPFLNIQDWVKERESMVAMADMYATVIMPEFSLEGATIEAQEVHSWKQTIYSISRYAYWGIVALLIIQLLMQIGNLIKLVLTTRSSVMLKVNVHILSRPSGPFSFFKWIFIHPDSHTENEINEILTHEQTHARQWHSVDVVLSELVCIACWFNPFAWLLQREIRSNLEYLADQQVLKTGHDRKIYQYHLLGLANQKQVATLYNNFNVLPLKKRITMMNKKRSRQISQAKYFIFPLLAALLLIVSNIEIFARTTERVINEIMADATEAAGISNEVVVAIDQEDPVFEVVEKMPEFPGGQEGLMKFLGNNIKYPATAQQNGTQGRVIVSFVVNKDGSISDTEVVRSVSPELDEEAKRVVNSFPEWIPGKQRGQNVRVKYTVPIQFRLGTPASTKKNEAVIDANGIYEVVDQMPRFPGGQEALINFLSTNIRYPEKARESAIQGRVIVQFIVNSDGSISDPKVVRSIESELDAEAIRIVKSMPKWEPGKHDGKDVPVKYTIPITFKP